MESRNNNKVKKSRLLDLQKTLTNKQIEHTPNPQHRNSSQHSEYSQNQTVRESINK